MDLIWLKMRLRLRLAMVALVAGLALPAAGCWAQEKPPHGVVVMYHHFGVGEYPSTNITLEQFEAHLSYLDRHDYQVWPLTRLIEHIRQGQAVPERTVAITVDDAYRSVYTEAYPRLKARGWPFTVFVATDYVDRGLKNYMTWAQMREMQAHGASFANHSSAHAYMIRRREGESETEWRRRMRDDITKAQSRLEAELGQAPKLFAYPFGEYSEPLAALVRELGYIAFGQHSGAIGPGSDLRALPRFPLNEYYGTLEEFELKVASLPMPVASVTPWDPVTPADRPRLEVTLEADGLAKDRLRCFVSGQGPTEVEWLDTTPPAFALQAREPLPEGRSRYNCTVPSGEGGRFHWYSHLWIRPQTASPAQGPAQ